MGGGKPQVSVNQAAEGSGASGGQAQRVPGKAFLRTFASLIAPLLVRSCSAARLAAAAGSSMPADMATREGVGGGEGGEAVTAATAADSADLMSTDREGAGTFNRSWQVGGKVCRQHGADAGGAPLAPLTSYQRLERLVEPRARPAKPLARRRAERGDEQRAVGVLVDSGDVTTARRDHARAAALHRALC